MFAKPLKILEDIQKQQILQMVCDGAEEPPGIFQSLKKRCIRQPVCRPDTFSVETDSNKTFFRDANCFTGLYSQIKDLAGLSKENTPPAFH